MVISGKGSDDKGSLPCKLILILLPAEIVYGYQTYKNMELVQGCQLFSQELPSQVFPEQIETALTMAKTFMPGLRSSFRRALRVMVETIEEYAGDSAGDSAGDPVSDPVGELIFRFTFTRSLPFRAFMTSVTVAGKMF